MTTPIRVAALLVLGSALVFSQGAPPPPRLAFEVASIKPSPEAEPGTGRVSLTIDGSQVHCRFFSLKDYIGMAYNLKSYQVAGPDWIAGARFDITAKLPEGGTRAQVGEMIQTLLEERFKLKMHRESKDFPVYALTVGKTGHKMKDAPPDDPADPAKGNVNVQAQGSRNGVFLDLGKGSSVSLANNKVEAKKVTMGSFTDTLGRFLDRPVVDMTSLPGNFDFVLDFSAEDFQAMMIRSAVNAGVSLPPQALRALEYGDGDSILNAVQSVGLKLDRRKAPLPVLAVDSIEKVPIEN